MEVPSFEAYKTGVEQSGNIVEISWSAFNRVALEEGNPYGVATFGVMSNRPPYEGIVFVDKDIFKMARPSNPEETFEDIKEFCIEHELKEMYGMFTDRLAGQNNAVGNIDTTHDETARYHHLRLAHEAGLLDKMLEFHAAIQLICQWQIERYFGRPHIDGPDAETIGLIQKTQLIAERIRRESDKTDASTGMDTES